MSRKYNNMYHNFHMPIHEVCPAHGVPHTEVARLQRWVVNLDMVECSGHDACTSITCGTLFKNVFHSSDWCEIACQGRRNVL